MIIHNVEQGSEEWLNLKRGKITGTKVKDIFKSNNLTLVDKLIAELESGEIKEIPTSFAMQRGMDLEPLAIKKYMAYDKVKVEQVGFIESEYEWFGLSPDGIIKHKNEIVKAIEIKCPDSATHIKYMRMGGIPNEYKYQCYTYFLVIPTLKELDFISFDPRLSFNPLHVVTISREEIQKELEDTMKTILKFWDKVQNYHNKVIGF